MADDTGYNDLGSFGGEFQTPDLDDLAAVGGGAAGPVAGLRDVPGRPVGSAAAKLRGPGAVAMVSG